LQLADEYNNAHCTDYCEESELEDEIRYYHTGNSNWDANDVTVRTQ